MDSLVYSGGSMVWWAVVAVSSVDIDRLLQLRSFPMGNWKKNQNKRKTEP